MSIIVTINNTHGAHKMSFLKNLKNSLSSTIESYGRYKTLSYLNNLGDRTLDDLGFSRALLSQGVDAWPWRTDEVRNAANRNQDSTSITAAIEELTAYNDAELADLGISRGQIREAVLNGRVGIESSKAA
jgi:uncharacterized protein YjiS (DUF1127 family)